MMRVFRGVVSLLVFSAVWPAAEAIAQPANRVEYRVLATSKTSTMEKELNEAAEAGFRFLSVMGGETAVGGKEVVTVMGRSDGNRPRYQYKLVATNKTSTMQRELQEAADQGFEYLDAREGTPGGGRSGLHRAWHDGGENTGRRHGAGRHHQASGAVIPRRALPWL